MTFATTYDSRIEVLRLSDGDKKFLHLRGIVYVGELFYVWFNPSVPTAIRMKRRFAEVLEKHGFDSEADPIGSGWEPTYWSDRAFVDALDLLVLDVIPTPPSPVTWRHADVASCVCPDERGIARLWHKHGSFHFVGEVMNGFHSKHLHQGRRSPQDLASLRVFLGCNHIPLWAGCLVPKTWKPKDWNGDSWRRELEDIAREEEKFRIAKDNFLQSQGGSTEASCAEVGPLAKSVFKKRLASLHVSQSLLNALEGSGIRTVLDIVQKGFTRKHLRKLAPKLSKDHIDEIERLLSDLGGLRLGMSEREIREWSPQ